MTQQVAVFTPEAVARVLLDAGFTAFTYDDINKPGFKVGLGGGGTLIKVWLKGAGVCDFGPGQGPRVVEALWLRELDCTGYEVRSTGSEVVVAGVKS